jgi:hypothetical protein
MDRIDIRTKTGLFTLPINYQVAVATDEGVRYKFASELSPGDVVIVNKPSSDLTLEEVCGTLYVRSPSYREDRNRVFMSKGYELPKETRLAHYLKMAMQNARLTEREMIEMIASYGYSPSEARHWLKHKIMFPNKPDVLIDIANRTNYYPLKEWTNLINSLPPQKNPVKKLRALHRALMSKLARPRGVGGGEFGKAEYEKILYLFPYLEELKRKYGEDFLKEVEIPFEVLSVEDAEGGEVREPAPPIKIRKKLVGFPIDDLERAKKVIQKYGGRPRNEEIEECLEKRAKLIEGVADSWAQLAVTDYYILTRSELDQFERLVQHRLKYGRSVYIEKEMRKLRRLSDSHYSFAIYEIPVYVNYLFSPIFGTKESTDDLLEEKNRFYEMLIENKEQRKRLVNLIKSKPHKIIRDGEKLPYLRFFIQRFRKVYDASSIEKRVLSFEEWFSCVCPDFVSPVQGFLKIMCEKPPNEWPRLLEKNRILLKEFNDFLWDKMVTPEILEVKERCKEIENSGLPEAAIIAQDFFFPNRNEYYDRCFDKLKRKYGISSFHEITPKIVERIEQSLELLDIKR